MLKENISHVQELVIQQLSNMTVKQETKCTYLVVKAMKINLMIHGNSILLLDNGNSLAKVTVEMMFQEVVADMQQVSTDVTWLSMEVYTMFAKN